MIKKLAITVYCLFFASILYATNIHYIILKSGSADSYASRLFEEAAEVFSAAFLEAYANVGVTELGGVAYETDDENAQKRIILRNIVKEDHHLYLRSLEKKEEEYIFIFALFDQQVVGYRSIKKCSNDSIYSRQGAVNPRFQRMGISTMLLNKYLDVWPDINTIYVCTRILNAKSNGFWQALGFQECPLNEVNQVAQTAYSSEYYRGYKRNNAGI